MNFILYVCGVFILGVGKNDFFWEMWVIFGEYLINFKSEKFGGKKPQEKKKEKKRVARKLAAVASSWGHTG